MPPPGSADGSGESKVPIILPETPTASSAADIMQSADDDLDPDAVRAKSHEEVCSISWTQLVAVLHRPTVQDCMEGSLDGSWRVACAVAP